MIFTILEFVYVDFNGSAMRLIYDYCRTKYLNEVLVGNVCAVCFSLCLCTATCNCVDERAMMCFILLHLRNFAAAVEEWEKNRRKLLFFAKMCDANEFLVSAKSNAWVFCY